MNRFSTLSLLSLAVALGACGGGDVPPADSTPSATAPAAADTAPAASETTPAAAGTPTTTVAAASIAGAGTTSTSGSSLLPEKNCGLSSFAQDMLDRINAARAIGRTCGTTFYKAAAPIAWNAKLFDAAAGHALDMAANNYFSHTGKDGRTFSQRITAAGYSWSAAGENIAGGQPTPEQVMNGWLQSAGHCANIMSPNFSEVGVACARNDASTYRTYWVMDLARPR